MGKKEQKGGEACHTLGGQAVLEGVMVKSKHSLAVAVRAPSNKIVIKKQKLHPISERVKVLGWPFLRGTVTLFEMLGVGVKALNYSADVASGKKEKDSSGWELAFTLVLSIVLALAIFKLLPLAITQFLSGNFSNTGRGVFFNLVEGLIKVGIFVLYIYLIGRIKDIKRLFQYHGAEHMSIACFESGKKLVPKNVRLFSPIHRRCGTTFLFLVIFLSIIVYTFIPPSLGFWEKLLWRIVLLPAIAGISYEVLKLGAKYEDSMLITAIVTPGLWIQKMTTAYPDNSQVEVAIASVKAVAEMEKAH